VANNATGVVVASKHFSMDRYHSYYMMWATLVFSLVSWCFEIAAAVTLHRLRAQGWSALHSNTLQAPLTVSPHELPAQPRAFSPGSPALVLAHPRPATTTRSAAKARPKPVALLPLHPYPAACPAAVVLRHLWAGAWFWMFAVSCSHSCVGSSSPPATRGERGGDPIPQAPRLFPECRVAMDSAKPP
jgi:hypothetical protein